MSLRADGSCDSRVGVVFARETARRTREEAARGLVRVLVVADAEIMVAGIGMLFEAYQDRVLLSGSVSFDENVVAAVAACRPDVVLIDADRRGTVDLQSVVPLVGREPGLRVVVLTQCRDDYQLIQALQAGVAGYLLKSVTGAELVDHLERVRNGQVAVDHSMTSRLALAVGKKEVLDGWPGQCAGLTKRESDVLRLLAEGLSNQEIAQRLFVGQETVKTHLSSLYRKLDVSDRAGAVAKALRNGMVS